MVSVVGIWLFVCPCGVILRGRLEEMCVGRRGGGSLGKYGKSVP